MLRFVRTRYFEVLAFGVGMGILLFFSCYKLSESPPIWYDEGFFTQMGMNVADHGAQNMQVAPNMYVSAAYITAGYPLIMPLAISYKLFGVGVVQGRAVMVIFIFGLTLASYALMRRLFGVPQALSTLFLLASFPMLYGNGKTVLGEIPGLFFLVVCVWSLVNLERSIFKDWRWYVAVGLTAGLCAATKPIFIPFLAALFFTYLFRIRKISLSLQGTLLGSLALLATLALWVFLQFGSDSSVGAVLADYINPYAVENVRALILQNALRFITESTPMYTAVMLVVWSIALFVRRNKDIASAEIAAFIFCILILLSYLRLAGWYRYFFPATIVALVFLPNSVRVFFETVKKRVSLLSWLPWLPYAAIALLACGQLYQTARTSFVAEYYNSPRTKDLAEMIASLDPRAMYFLYNMPQAAVLLPSMQYYQYLSPLPKVILGADQLSALKNGIPDIVIISNDDYHKSPELFAKYRLLKPVNAYIFLAKKL